jgi:hypothetical protein
MLEVLETIVNDESIQIIIKKDEIPFVVIYKPKVEGGALESITDWVTRVGNKKVIITFKVNVIYGRIFRRKHLTDCHRLVIDVESKTAKSYTDGIKTSEWSIHNL